MMSKWKIVSLALASALAGFAASQAAAQPGAEVTSAPKTEASADLKLFALILRPGSTWKPGRPFEEQGLRDHFFYWKGLFRAGRIASFGPLGNDSGLVILTARSLGDAEAIMYADPANKAKIFTGDVLPYIPRMINVEALSDKD